MALQTAQMHQLLLSRLAAAALQPDANPWSPQVRCGRGLPLPAKPGGGGTSRAPTERGGGRTRTAQVFQRSLGTGLGRSAACLHPGPGSVGARGATRQWMWAGTWQGRTWRGGRKGAREAGA